MQWKEHFKLKGKHAILSPSQPCWLKYEPERLVEYATNKAAAERGTELHEWAAKTIKLGIRQACPRGKTPTLQAYVNDAIAFHMDPEVPLYYSDYCFGTADAISFINGKLRIHDLKTGSGRIHPEQLVVYAALFCLEYREEPERLNLIELRVYQNDEVMVLDVEPEDVREAMNVIVAHDKVLRESII